MWLMKEWRLSTWTVAAVLAYVRRLPSVGLLECGLCGSAIAARKEDGISSFVYVIDCNAPNSSRFSAVLEVTESGKLLISCGCSQSAGHPSQKHSG